MDRADLERLDRESLVLRAQAAGVKRARVLTRPELVDELLRLDARSGGVTAENESQLKRSRGFFGLARDLLSRVVERGLHLPDAAEKLRAALVDPVPNVPRPEAQAIPTVTLAEIYAAQGHKERAIDTLRRVLQDEPDHLAARALLEKLEAADYVAPEAKLPPEPEVEVVAEASDEDDEDDEAHISTPPPPPPVTPEPMTSRVPSPPTASQPVVRVIDRCVAIPRPNAHYVWWQLSPASRRLADESFFFVRVVAIIPAVAGPRVTTKDIAADPHAGELVLRDLPPGAVVRIAIGFVPEGEFVPVAHSPALEADPSGGLRHWRFGTGESVLSDEVVRAAAERAASVTAG